MSRRKPAPPTCPTCGSRVTWFGDARGAGNRRRHNPRPVPVPERAATDARPVFGNQFWRPDELAEHFMQTRDVTRSEAREEVRDCSWFRPHTCEPPTPDTQPTTDATEEV